MLEIAAQNERRPDARVAWLLDWIKRRHAQGSFVWNERRLIIFTEWEDTRLWLERRLKEALAIRTSPRSASPPSPGSPARSGASEVKRAFNADPANDPLRILHLLLMRRGKALICRGAA